MTAHINIYKKVLPGLSFHKFPYTSKLFQSPQVIFQSYCNLHQTYFDVTLARATSRCMAVSRFYMSNQICTTRISACQGKANISHFLLGDLKRVSSVCEKPARFLTAHSRRPPIGLDLSHCKLPFTHRPRIKQTPNPVSSPHQLSSHPPDAAGEGGRERGRQTGPD